MMPLFKFLWWTFADTQEFLMFIFIWLVVAPFFLAAEVASSLNALFALLIVTVYVTTIWSIKKDAVAVLKPVGRFSLGVGFIALVTGFLTVSSGGNVLLQQPTLIGLFMLPIGVVALRVYRRRTS